MKAFLGEMERRQVKYRTKKAMEYKKKQGSVVGAVPYGYRRNGKGLEPDEGEQAAICFINACYAKSFKLKTILPPCVKKASLRKWEGTSPLNRYGGS